ncbi:MAG: thiosulfate sulfurtransferase GlpE [Prevotella sp.]|jgi:thiosulfate sulfurtransferase|nr:thiosulfate sulfurtransferase GlpE [Prevotella sp.]
MSFKRINHNQAEDLLNNSNAILVDIRDEESYNTSHDERAINLLHWTFPQFLFETNKELPILVLCYHGNSSQMVAEFLFQQGFSDVYSIDGGYAEWILNNA